MKAHALCAAFSYGAFCVVAATLCTGIAHASGPIAVYALVDRVEFEPSSGKPERIRISGVFIEAEDNNSGDSHRHSTVYSAPQRGYLYYELPKGNEELARREWADLKSVAGTRQVVGFGVGLGPKVHVKPPNEEAQLPVDYPMGNGVVKINSDQPSARALLDYKGR
jgi:hypothetical protein